MAQITITIPDDQVDRVKAAFASRLGGVYDEEGEPREINVDDVKAEVGNIIIKVVRQHEKDAAAKTARDSTTDVSPS